MKTNVFGGLICFLLIACDKAVPVDLTDYDKPKLVVEGRITNKVELQKFQITSTANLGSDQANPIDNVALEVKTPGGIVGFNSLGQGKYESEIPFAGSPGAWYKIDFSYNGIDHSANTQMPAEISLDNFTLLVEDGFMPSGSPSILLDLNSAQTQYFRFDLYKLDKTSADSNWISMEVPVYETHLAESGSNLYWIDYVSSSFYYFDSTDVARIIVYSLSADVAAYLKKLKDFMNYEPKGGRYENPPYYFSNEAYGLGYGSVADTAYFSY
jgi:hypothetical protein